MTLSAKDIQFAQAVVARAMVNQAHGPAAADLTTEESAALLEATRNDGVVTPDELKGFDRFTHADRLKEIGQYIGNTPRQLFAAASRLSNGRFYREWHSQQRGPATLRGDVHASLHTPQDTAAEKAGLSALQQLSRRGVNIYPALSAMLQGGSLSPRVAKALDQLDLTSLNAPERQMISEQLLGHLQMTRQCSLTAPAIIRALIQLNHKPALDRAVVTVARLMTTDGWTSNPEPSRAAIAALQKL